MTSKQWESRWRKKLKDLPPQLESIMQLNIIMSATIDRYEVDNKLADVILWGSVQDQMNRLWNEKATPSQT